MSQPAFVPRAIVPPKLAPQDGGPEGRDVYSHAPPNTPQAPAERNGVRRIPFCIALSARISLLRSLRVFWAAVLQICRPSRGFDWAASSHFDEMEVGSFPSAI